MGSEASKPNPDAFRASLHRICQSDPLITAMVFMDTVEQRAVPSYRLPPLLPMVMQLVNVHAAHDVMLPCNDPLVVGGPNWYTVGGYRDDGPDGNEFFQEQSARFVASSRMKGTLELTRSRCAIITCWPIDARVGQLLPVVDTVQWEPSAFPDGDVADPDEQLVVDVLASMTALRSLRICGPMPGTSISSRSLGCLVSALLFLRKLELDNCAVESLNNLTNAPCLTHLAARRCPALTDKGIRSLGKCPALRKLAFEDCVLVGDVSSLSNCLQLEELHLRGPVCRGRVGLVCSGVAALRTLRVSDIPMDLEATVATLPHVLRLEVHALGNAVGLTDRELLPVLPSVVSLRLGTCPQDLPWSTCVHLVDVAVAKVSKLDLCALAQLPSLTSLSFGSGVTVVGSLRASRCLQRVHCFEDLKAVIEGLSSVPSLTELSCRVHSDVKYVNACRSLRCLRLSLNRRPSDCLPYLCGLVLLEQLHICVGRFKSTNNEASAVRAALAVSLPCLRRISVSSLGTDATAQLNLSLARRSLHSSWFLEDA